MQARPLTLALALCCLAPAAHAEGALVIVGGALDRENEAVYRAVLDRVPEGRKLCIVPTASGEPAAAASGYVSEFEGYGGEGVAVAVPLTVRTRQRALEDDFAHDLMACGGFFFTGGDQSRIVDVLRPDGKDSPAARALRAVHQAGGVIAGSSAGAAMMSDPMIGAGNPETALRRGVVDEDGKRGIWIRNGMGFLARGITGQHFLARGRISRLMVALQAHPAERFGIGVDEDTAAIVEGASLSVVGSSQVALVELLDDRRFRLTLLGAGDEADLESGSATPAEHKQPLSRLDAPKPPRHPFRDAALHEFLLDFAGSDISSADLRAKPYTLRVSRDEGFEARAERDEKGADLRATIFAGPFLLELVGAEDSR